MYKNQEQHTFMSQRDSTLTFDGNTFAFPFLVSDMRLALGKLPKGTQLVKSTFVTPSTSAEDLASITTLRNRTSAYLRNGPPQGSQNVIINANNQQANDLAQLKQLIDAAAEVDKELEILTSSSIKAMEIMLNATSDAAHTSVQSVQNQTDIHPTMKPLSALLQLRREFFPPASSKDCHEQAKRKIEAMPQATSLAQLQNNTEALARANLYVTQLIEENLSFFRPLIIATDAEITEIEQRIHQIQAPPANHPQGQAHQIDQQALDIARQDEHRLLTQRHNLDYQFRQDEVSPLESSTMGRILLQTIPRESNNLDISALRQAISTLVYTSNRVVQYEEYKTLVNQCIQRTSHLDAMSNNRHRAMGAIHTEEGEVQTAAAAYARPGGNRPSGGGQQTPCHNYSILGQCNNDPCDYAHSGLPGAHRQYTPLVSALEHQKQQNKDLLHQLQAARQQLQQHGTGGNNNNNNNNNGRSHNNNNNNNGRSTNDQDDRNRRSSGYYKGYNDGPDNNRSRSQDSRNSNDSGNRQSRKRGRSGDGRGYGGGSPYQSPHSSRSNSRESDQGRDRRGSGRN
jgi:hypothetical protein